MSFERLRKIYASGRRIGKQVKALYEPVTVISKGVLKFATGSKGSVHK